MVKWPIYLASAVVFLLAVFLAHTAYRVRREAKKKREDVKWLLEQLERALDDIKSEDEDRILGGLQTLTYLNDAATRLKSLPRLAELAQSNNQLIARQAEVTMQKLSSFANR